MLTDWAAALDEIRRDNRSGATALLLRAADVLREVADTLPSAGAEWRPDLTDAARAVASVRPPFAGFVRLASIVLDAADTSADTGVAQQRIGAAIGAFLAMLESDAGRCAEQATRTLAGLRATTGSGTRQHEAGLALLTISASSLVERAILATASAMRLRVTCLESRPAREGVALAERLAAAGCTVALAIDAAGPALAASVDAVLLGCDTLAPAGLVHKIGTYGMALAAHCADTPVYTLAGSEKLLPSIVRGALDDGGPPDELISAPPPGLIVMNRYFDRTPFDLLAGVILPDGLHPPEAAARRASAVTVHPSLADLLER